MVNSVMATLPISFLCCLDVPITIKEQVVKYMRHCLWRKKNNDVQAKGSALVAWKKIARPKNKGGLGVLNLHVQNDALLMKNRHKFYNKHDIPWVSLVWSSYYENGSLPGNHSEGSFWWRAHLKLVDQYKAMARCNIGDGKSVYFWTDLWQENCLHQKLPHLVSFAKNTNVTIFMLSILNILKTCFIFPFHQRHMLSLP